MRTATFLQTARAVLWSFFGVRRRREFERSGWRVIDVAADDLGPARHEFLAAVRALLATIGRS